VFNGGMSESESTESERSPTPDTSNFLLGTFADLYRQEVAAEEDVHRTLPFFGTALGIVIGALAYAAGRLPKWTDVLASGHGRIAFWTASLLLTLAIVEATLVLVFISRAISRRDYQRIGPERALRDRMSELEAYYIDQEVSGESRDNAIATDMRQALLDSYTAVTPTNRNLNQRRYHFRALASSHLVRSLIWALAATTVIFMTDKLGYLPKAPP
jgi:hypothetical protein